MIKIKELSNGIRLVLEDIPYVKSMSIGIWMRAGAVDETVKYSGISHFVEHMMFKGTKTRSAKQIAEDIDKIGGQVNAFTGKEATCYYVKTISSNYHQAADVLVDMLTNSVFDREEMNRERKVICEEIKMSQDQPDDVAHDSIVEQVFKGDPLGKSIIGTATSLKRITRNVMVDYIENEYTRDNMVISIAGNFDEDEVCGFFEDKFNSLKSSKPEKVHDLKPYEPSFKSFTKDIKQAHICLANRSISVDDDRSYAFSILNNIMGGSMSSRLFQSIREKKGLAYTVYCLNPCFSTSGYFNIYAGVAHDKVEQAINAIKEELAILEKDGVTKEELESSREQMKSGYIFGQENVNGRMFVNGKNATLFNKIFTPDEVIDGYDKVSLKDLHEITSMICNVDSYSAVVVSNKKMNVKKMVRG